MRLRFGTVLAAALCGVVAAEAGNGREMWDIYTDFGLFEGAVRRTEKGFAADENGIRVETEVETGVSWTPSASRAATSRSTRRPTRG